MKVTFSEVWSFCGSLASMLGLGIAFKVLKEEKRIEHDLEDPIHICTRPAPHICAVNGPCNGWPKFAGGGQKIFSENRRREANETVERDREKVAGNFQEAQSQADGYSGDSQNHS